MLMSIFHFKQFSVQNEKSAMKVNTDSVLLGAWAEIPEDSKIGIDIGSGTGLLALMIAQRNPKIKITGIEIEKNAFEESKINFKNSPYSKRLKAVNLPLQKFETEVKFDVIISNPPYFVNDLKNQTQNKTTARHTDSMSFEELLFFAENNLSNYGKFSLVLPKIESQLFIFLSEKTSLHLQQVAFIQPNSAKSVNRVLMCFGKEKTKLIEETFCVYQSQGVYSKEHHELTKDFYLEKK